MAGGMTYEMIFHCDQLCFSQEWKVINPYHVHVRRKTAMDTKHFVRMSLQLYQVDYKSFLLDFKSLPVTEDENRSSEELSGNQS